jgi:hypothetical protein
MDGAQFDRLMTVLEKIAERLLEISESLEDFQADIDRVVVNDSADKLETLGQSYHLRIGSNK